MAGNADNVAFGPCIVMYDGVDLGYTHGGIEFILKDESIDKYNDQELTSSMTMTTKREVSVNVPLAEESYSMLCGIFNTSTVYHTNGVAEALTFRSHLQNPWNFYTIRPLVLVPLPIRADENDRIVIPNATPIFDVTTKYDQDSTRVYNVVFKANSYQDKLIYFGNTGQSYI